MDLILASIPRYTTHINPFFFVSSDMIKSIAFVKKSTLNLLHSLHFQNRFDYDGT